MDTFNRTFGVDQAKRMRKLAREGRRKRFKIFLLILIIAMGLLYYFALSVPRSFPNRSIISVKEGDTLYEVAEALREDNAIRSSFWFRNIAIFLGGERGLQAGDYYLSHPENALSLARRIVTGDYDIEMARITIPEGFTVEDISNLFDERFAFFNHEYFTEHAKEGYMFPDTYFWPVTVTAETVLNRLNENFETKISEVEKLLQGSALSLRDVITLASIVETEAKHAEDRSLVAGILLKRLEEDMPLQVDATLRYVTGRASHELTKNDLESDSPYNSYKFAGLPPTPISNPGLESIKAVLDPIETEFLYFLTGDDGDMYYSKTFEEHMNKRAKYIKDTEE